MDPITRLRDGQSVTVYDRLKKLFFRFRPSQGRYRFECSDDRHSWVTYKIPLTLQDCSNVLEEISDHNRQAGYPGQEELKLTA